jgi:hypothetical protein
MQIKTADRMLFDHLREMEEDQALLRAKLDEKKAKEEEAKQQSRPRAEGKSSNTCPEGPLALSPRGRRQQLCPSLGLCFSCVRSRDEGSRRRRYASCSFFSL